MGAMITVEQLGQEVRKRRGQRSFKELEAESSVSASTLWRVEQGHVPDVGTIRKIADWLGVNVRTAGGPEQGIRSPEDLVRATEVYLRAEKNLPEQLARSIAQTVKTVMEWELQKAQRKNG